MAIASLRTHTDAVLAKLRTSGVAVGDAEKPAGTGWANNKPGQTPFLPYMVLYRILASFDGTLGDPDIDAELEYQVTCVGETRIQCEWVADKAVDALVGNTITVTGRSLNQRIYLADGSGIRRDDTVNPAVFLTTPRFSVYTTPS